MNKLFLLIICCFISFSSASIAMTDAELYKRSSSMARILIQNDTPKSVLPWLRLDVIAEDDIKAENGRCYAVPSQETSAIDIKPGTYHIQLWLRSTMGWDTAKCFSVGITRSCHLLIKYDPNSPNPLTGNDIEVDPSGKGRISSKFASQPTILKHLPLEYFYK